MVIGPSLYLHSFNKLGKGTYRWVVGWNFLEIFKKYGPDG